MSEQKKKEKDTKAAPTMAAAAAALEVSSKTKSPPPEQAPMKKNTHSQTKDQEEDASIIKHDPDAIIHVDNDDDDEEAMLAVPPPPEAPQPRTGRATAPGAVAVPSPFGVRGHDDSDDDDSEYGSANQEDEEEGGVVIQGEVVDHEEYRRQALEGTIEAHVVDSETPKAKKQRQRRLVLAVMVILAAVIASIVTAVVVSNNKNNGDSASAQQDTENSLDGDVGLKASPVPSKSPSQAPTSSPSDHPSWQPSLQPSLLPSSAPSRLLFETQESLIIDGRYAAPNADGTPWEYTDTNGGNFGGTVSMTPFPQDDDTDTSTNTMLVWSAFSTQQVYIHLLASPEEGQFRVELRALIAYVCDFEDDELKQCTLGYRPGFFFGNGGGTWKLSAAGSRLGVVVKDEFAGSTARYFNFDQFDLSNNTDARTDTFENFELSGAPIDAFDISLSPEGNYLSVVGQQEVAVYRIDSNFGENSFSFWRWSAPITSTVETAVATSMNDKFVAIATNLNDFGDGDEDFCSPCPVEGQYFDGAKLRVFDMFRTFFFPGGGVLSEIGAPVGQDIDLGKPASILSDSSVALVAAGTILAVGFSTLPESPEVSTDRIDFGQVHVYELDVQQLEVGLQEEWVLRGSPIVSSEQGDGFGYSVDISTDGQILTVGAPFAQSGSGMVYSFRFNGQDWESFGDVLVGSAGASFGESLALSASGKELVVGSPTNTDLGPDAGLVNAYVVISE